MTRTPRILAALVGGALVVSLTAAAVPAQAQGPTQLSRHPGFTVGHSALSSSTYTSLRPVSARRATHWPVGSRTGTLRQHATATPSTVPAQTLVAAAVRQDRRSSTKLSSISFRVQLGAVPAADTTSQVVIAFGNVASDQTCRSPMGSNVNADTFTVSGGTTATLAVSNLHMAAAHAAAWNCSFVETLSSDGATEYDSLIGALVSHIQKPILGFKVKGTKLHEGRFAKVPVTILNSAATVATAKHVTISWKGRGVTVRGKHGVGNIAPGKAKKGVLMVKPTRPGKGTLKLTVKSGDYRHSITLKVKPIKKHHGHHHR